MPAVHRNLKNLRKPPLEEPPDFNFASYQNGEAGDPDYKYRDDEFVLNADARPSQPDALGLPISKLNPQERLSSQAGLSLERYQVVNASPRPQQFSQTPGEKVNRPRSLQSSPLLALLALAFSSRSNHKRARISCCTTRQQETRGASAFPFPFIALA